MEKIFFYAIMVRLTKFEATGGFYGSCHCDRYTDQSFYDRGGFVFSADQNRQGHACLVLGGDPCGSDGFTPYGNGEAWVCRGGAHCQYRHQSSEDPRALHFHDGPFYLS